LLVVEVAVLGRLLLITVVEEVLVVIVAPFQVNPLVVVQVLKRRYLYRQEIITQ
jgi:hypothetical protein